MGQASGKNSLQSGNHNDVCYIFKLIQKQTGSSMKIFRQLSCSILFFSFTTYTMENMQKINQWEEVKPFVDKIVACTSSLFLNKGYHIENYPTIQFGYVNSSSNGPFPWQSGEKGYELILLYQIKESSSTCALVNSNLKDFRMRLVTKKEATILLRAVNHHDAKFGYNDEDAKLALEQLVNKK